MIRKLRRVLLASIIVMFGTIISGQNLAYAQSDPDSNDAAGVPPELGPRAIESLVSKLDESQTAALVKLVELLNSSASGDDINLVDEGEPTFEIIKGWFTTFAANFKFHLQAFPNLFTSIGEAISSIFQGRELGGSLKFLLLVALTIGAGIVAEWLFNRSTSARREQIRQSRPNRLLDSLRILSTRAAIEIGGVIVFAIVAIIAANLFVSVENDLFLITAFVLNVIVMPRVFGSVMHFVLAPRRPELRLVHVESNQALLLERNFIQIAIFVGIAFFLAAVAIPNGIGSFDTMRFWLGLAVHAWLVIIVLRARHGLTQIIEGSDENLTTGLKRVADWWPGVSAALVAFNWFFLQFVLSSGHQTLSPQRSASAIALIVLAPFLDTIVRGIAGQLAPAADGSDEVVTNANHETRLGYIRIGRIILIGLIILAVAKLWGVNLLNLAEAGFGAEIAANTVGFLLIIAVGYFAWETTNLSINKRLAREIPAGDSGGEAAEGGTGQTRMATILPILRMTLQVTIIILTVLLALSQLGVNITPLLAGAGVLGLAIGFGAQTLVKDIVSGVFFLMDDAFRLGEFVTIGTTNGIVQKISVRSLHLRQDTGPIHIIPYGSMSQLTNNSRDYVTMKLRFTVPFDTDQEKVRKLFKKIGQEMMEVPELAEVLINPFKSQGAADVTDVGIVIRGKFTTVPGGQFLIRKEVYKRVQETFEANGIDFARKEIRVQLPEQVNPSALTDAQKNAISAAAGQESDAQKPKPDVP